MQRVEGCETEEGAHVGSGLGYRSEWQARRRAFFTTCKKIMVMVWE